MTNVTIYSEVGAVLTSDQSFTANYGGIVGWDHQADPVHDCVPTRRLRSTGAGKASCCCLGKNPMARTPYMTRLLVVV